MNHSVGQPWVRVDGSVKATGQAIYIDDVTLPGMLYGKFLGSPYAHARIKSINVERAKALPGVRAVVTGKDFPFLHGEAIINIPFLAIEKVRYVGDPVVAVAAEDWDTAEQALELVEIEYEELPAVFDPEEALKPDSVIIHEKLGEYKAISAIKVMPGTNICQHYTAVLGDVERGFRESDHIFEDRFSTPQMHHAAIEPHACIAQVNARGRITVWGHNDAPHRARKEIAQSLGIPQANVRVITAGYIGGNYGGKGGVKSEAIAIPLAYHLRGRPVKVVFSREEAFKILTRLGCVIYMKTGVRRDGTLLARQVRLIWDTGAYAEKGPTVTLHGSMQSAGPYAIPNVHIEAFTVFTNKPIAGAMRGYGLPQVAFAHESQMDIIAEKLGMNPLDLRMKNIVVDGSKLPTGQRVYAVGLKECLEKVGKELSKSTEVSFDSRGEFFPDGRWVRGKGIGCTYKATKTPTVSSAYVKIDEDGSVGIVTSTVEVGQGSYTVLTQIAAEVLTVDKDTITISFADTDVTPYDTSTTASRSTFHMGNAVLLAAHDARSQLLAMAAPLLQVAQHDLKLSDGAVVAADGRKISFAKVLSATFGAGAGAAILGKGVYTPNDILGLEDMGGGALEAFSTMSVFHAFAAQGAEVLVDLDTGAVRVLRVVAVDDVGKAINPMTCCQQLEGAISMGLGFCLTEEFIWDDKGRLCNANLRDYPLATASDSPDMNVFLVEKAHPQGPFGAKGVGEIANSSTAPAIANAVFNACGVRIRDLPMRPAKLLRELRAKATSPGHR
jgi:carbon-monoxide dehydrogenase large subunit